MIVDSIFTEKEIKIARLIKNAKTISDKLTMVVRYIHGEYDYITIESMAHPDDVKMLDDKIKDIERLFIELCESNKKDY
ncbi:hypothetical protein UFOVP270_52 [uncultured Caudovirales phage]|uniref:Uncharacterized protein n=1 Tax=uncultured Caudovirales phage TaxID=2100421 RepID=A0A6J5LLZ3_9CAUD|nr:hypothetical protein UFOVP101_5 [uncultured Caudovirales phage]CAB4134393.1 hypothetical protein UFOVP270_52 [uncultured Caudovirales phage]